MDRVGTSHPHRHPLAPALGLHPLRGGGDSGFGAARGGHTEVASPVVCAGDGETAFAGRKLRLKEINF